MLLLMFKGPVPGLKMPPPLLSWPNTELLASVLLLMLTVLEVSVTTQMAPPPILPPGLKTPLPLSVLLVTLSAPNLT